MPASHPNTLKKEERLRSRKVIQEVFRTGKPLNGFPLKVFYRTYNGQAPGVQVAFGVSARNFKKATDRNRVKRLLRESYRKLASDLKDAVLDREIFLAVFIVYAAGTLPEPGVLPGKMNKMLSRIIQEVGQDSTAL
ncbi:MAG: ribonuclease P protein component [Bacteroidota bacterium]|nr:ribonuclease P protein component [Bacteroidota bacterium]